ncbi:AAA family ATPase [Geodermatophilus sp. SYSU D00814]
MQESTARPRLQGRRDECDRLDALVATAKAGRSQVLVLRGEAGIGKTALLDYVLNRAAGCQVVRAAGVEAEMELAFSSLHQLCGPHLSRLGTLPPPQQEALRTAFGLQTGNPPDRYGVGLAVLTLLSALAEDKPLLCVLDDVQWLDRASSQTLEFVARRLEAEPIAMVVAARRSDDGTPFTGLPELPLYGLSDTDAATLLDTTVTGPLDPRVRQRILAECHGNPLALLELPHGLSAADLAFGGDGGGDAGSLTRRLEEGFLRQVQLLPRATQQVLLTAAAEPVGDIPLLRRASGRLGTRLEDVLAAETAGLVELRDRVRFRHPLVRSALYRSATHAERREVHRALADATDPDRDPDRRAWHRAHAAVGPDEAVAAELEASAGRALDHGGLAAAAAFLERSAGLTLDPARRSARLLTAAQVTQQAGDREAALDLLATAEAGPLDDLQRARAGVIRGQIAFTSADGRRAPRLLLDAAGELQQVHAALARDTYRDALTAALFVGRLAGDVGVVQVAEAAARMGPPRSARPADLLLTGLTLMITRGHAAGAPLVRHAVTAFSTEDLPDMEALRWLWLATHAAHDVWDDEGWDVLCARHIGLARQAGALGVLPLALSARIGFLLHAGELSQAATLVDEVAAVTDVTGNRLPPYGALALAARQGWEPRAAALIRTTRDELVPRGEGMGLTLVDHAEAVLYNGLGRYGEALTAAEHAAAHPPELGFATLVLPELIEAASRSGQPARAAQALEEMAAQATATGTDWALGLAARCRALLSAGEVAEDLYSEAIERLSRTRMRMDLARTQLLYGEWLRRDRRRVDARAQLRTAHEALVEMGAEAFAERARRELLATGETVRKRSVETTGELTAQESHIARLAVDGLTNPQIGAALYISPRTVEWHLRMVYEKLGVKTRRDLERLMPDQTGFPVAT